METTSSADAENRLSELVSAVQGTWERVTITKNGRPAAVLVAVEDLESLIETCESSPIRRRWPPSPSTGPGRESRPRARRCDACMWPAA